MAKAKTKVQQSETHNESNILCNFDQSILKSEKFHEKAYSHQSGKKKKKEKQFKHSIFYSAVLSYTAVIQNKNPEAMQNSES